MKYVLGNSKKIFMLFAALNALGYNDENNPNGMSPARKRVRTALRQHNWQIVYPAISRAVKQHHPWHLIHTFYCFQELRVPLVVSFQTSANFPMNRCCKNYGELPELTKLRRSSDSSQSLSEKQAE